MSYPENHYELDLTATDINRIIAAMEAVKKMSEMETTKAGLAETIESINNQVDNQDEAAFESWSVKKAQGDVGYNSINGGRKPQ